VYREIFVSNVLRMMRERGWNKGDLAEKSGISPSFLSELTSRDGNPSLKIMIRLSETFETPLPAMLEHTDLDPQTVEELLNAETHGAPEGHKWVLALLPEHQAFIVKRWYETALKRLNDEAAETSTEKK
jgi:transcriptional regulator with XRE-family HTH domain